MDTKKIVISGNPYNKPPKVLSEPDSEHESEPDSEQEPDTESESTSESDSGSESSSSSSEETKCKEAEDDNDSDLSVSTTDILSSDPLYFILSQFFLTDDQKNIATILEEINQKLGRLAR